MTAGQDGRDSFCGREEAVRGFRDGTVKHNWKVFLSGTGRQESKVGEVIDGTGQARTAVAF